MPDSLANIKAVPDSLAHVIIIPPYEAADTLINTDLDQALAAAYDASGTDLEALRIVVPPPPPTWRDGIEGVPRHLNIGDNNGVLAIITCMFVLMLVGYRHCQRLFATLFRELLGMRRRANVFDERTSNESQVMVLLAVQWSVYTGLLLYSQIAATHALDYARAFTDAMKLIGVTGAYWVFQLCAYWTVGYTFATSAGRRYFVQGFTSSQSLLGFTLIIPTLVAIFYPVAAPLMLNIAAWLYISARIIFIVKGFRIFYQKIDSLLYFILYLCTLEIIPIIVLYKIALLLVE